MVVSDSSKAVQDRVQGRSLRTRKPNHETPHRNPSRRHHSAACRQFHHLEQSRRSTPSPPTHRPRPTSRSATEHSPGQSVVSWAIVPYATHYRIGYINMDDYAALVRSSPTASWRQTITFAELDARDIIRSDGRMEFTVQHLEPGVNSAFTVLTSNDAHWDADTVSGAFIWPKDPTWTTHIVLDHANIPPQSQAGSPSGPASTPQPTPTPTLQPTPTATHQPTPVPTATPPTQPQPTRLTRRPPPRPPPTPFPPPRRSNYASRRGSTCSHSSTKPRADAHLPPVSLGQNQAAQLHAQDMLDTCFISHWGSDGLKPHMRYTLTNGQQASSENVLLSGDCFNTVQIGTGLTAHRARHERHARHS